MEVAGGFSERMGAYRVLAGEVAAAAGETGSHGRSVQYQISVIWSGGALLAAGGGCSVCFWHCAVASSRACKVCVCVFDLRMCRFEPPVRPH